MSYSLNTALDDERARLDAQAQLWDPGSIRWLTDAGVAQGAVVAEVGAGAGSIADWMCRTVGPSGRVLATDIETSQVTKLGHANLTVLVHDIRAAPLPGGPYDVVHCRLVLMHMQAAEDRALANMAGSLKPGGKLVVEDHDIFSEAANSPTLSKLVDAITAMFKSAGADTATGRRLPMLLEKAGLTDIVAEGRVALSKAPDTQAAMFYSQVREKLIATGLVDGAVVDKAIAEVSGELKVGIYSPVMVACRGTRA